MFRGLSDAKVDSAVEMIVDGVGKEFLIAGHTPIGKGNVLGEVPRQGDPTAERLSGQPLLRVPALLSFAC